MLTEHQELTNYYVESKGIKATNRVYVAHMGCFKALLKAGYSKQDIIDTIDYLNAHPPKSGYSPAFIQYVIDDTLPKIKVKKMEEIQKFFEPSETIKDDNSEKYKRNKTEIKGLEVF